jgi:YgiT-type zinc finger domain-containing protein
LFELADENFTLGDAVGVILKISNRFQFTDDESHISYKCMVKNDCYCGGTTQGRHITKTISLRGEKIPLENVLVRVCSDCGEIYFDGKMIDSLDRKSEKNIDKAHH